MSSFVSRTGLGAALYLVPTVAAFVLAACASGAEAPAAPRTAVVRATAAVSAAATRLGATIVDAAGVEIGFAKIGEDATGRAHVVVQVSGLAPGLHGMHLHAVGRCEAGFATAGGHHNPTGKEHGTLNPLGHHRGDLPNLVVNAEGLGQLTATLESVTVAELLDADGTAIVVHANEDDLRTNAGPAGPGNSGARIACGVLRD